MPDKEWRYLQTTKMVMARDWKLVCHEKKKKYKKCNKLSCSFHSSRTEAVNGKKKCVHCRAYAFKYHKEGISLSSQFIDFKRFNIQWQRHLIYGHQKINCANKLNFTYSASNHDQLIFLHVNCISLNFSSTIQIGTKSNTNT